MTAKEYLSQARQAELRIEALLERRRRCLELTRRRGRGQAALDRLESELDRQIGEYAALALEIEGRIDGLDSELQRDVLRYRYLNGWSWREISNRMRYSPSWVLKNHEDGLKALKNFCPGKIQE